MTDLTGWLSPEQASAEFPRFKPEWYREQLRAGKLRGSKVGGRWVIDPAAIKAMLEAGSNDPARSAASTRRRRRRAA